MKLPETPNMPYSLNDSTRQRLLSAGRTLFVSNGFKGTSTRAIATLADCNVSLIKYYFGSKEGLLREILRPYIETAGAHLDSAIATSGGVEDMVRSVVAVVQAQIDANRDNLRLVFQDLLTPASPLVDELKTLFLDNQQRIVAMMTNLKERGYLRNIDPAVAGMAMAGIIMFYYVAYPITSQIVGERSPEVLERMRTSIPEILINGIMGTVTRQENGPDPKEPS